MIGDITEPIKFEVTNVVKDMSNEDYHSHGSEVISSSFVKSVMKNGSVGHALKPFDGNTKALEFGTAFHDFMEHDGELPKDKYVECDYDQRTKAYKELKANNLDSIFLKSDEFEALHQMYENTQANEGYKALWNFGQCVREWSCFAMYGNLRYRVRFDMGFGNNPKDITDLVALADYKTTKSLKDFEADLNRSIKYKGGWRYDIQAVFYSDMLGIDPSNFYFVAVEKEAPYATQVFGLSEDAIYSARRDIYIAFHMIETWKESGEDGVIKHDIVRI